MTTPRELFEGNLLLKALRKADRSLLEPHLEMVEYGRGSTIFAAGGDVSYITFPATGRL